MDTLLTSMELTAKEAKQEVALEPEPPKYPWGLCIELDQDSLKKLGMETLPTVGSAMSLVAMVEVSSASEYQSQNDKEKRMSVSLQITAMDLKPTAGDISKVLYDGK